ncbi:conserved hypothetical protein [uncultured Gammaproteobacteria bacterium]
MAQEGEYQFIIDGHYTPATLPMKRLAEYMAEFSRLLGIEENVHFVGIEPGSAVLKTQVDEIKRPDVRNVLAELQRGAGPATSVRAYSKLDQMLAADNSVGRVVEGGADVLTFPGREKIIPIVLDGITEEGFLDGELISLGGKNDKVYAHLLNDNQTYHCQTHRELARKLARHIFGTPLRVYGQGQWRRTEQRIWQVTHFDIENFEVLDVTPLGDVVEKLRELPGNEWKSMSDPFEELRALRYGRDGEVA